MAGALPFRSPALLAPMEGVTDPAFRDLVLARNPPEALGGAFTEFVRVVREPLPAKTLLGHLGPHRFPQPVGLQIMGTSPEAIARTAREAARVGAPLIDLNFGCPSKRALRGCAGSALLDDPGKIEVLVRSIAQEIPEHPLSAKIRAGGEDDTRLEEIAQAVEAGGAWLLTVHCRTRKEAYRDTADWERLRRAVRAVSIPVCGNGGVEAHGDLARLREETGCRYVMVGRAALRDPWIFSGRRVTRAEAARFLVEYFETLLSRGSTAAKALGRLKQLIGYWEAGGLVPDEAWRTRWLRLQEPEALFGELRGLAGLALTLEAR